MIQVVLLRGVTSGLGTLVGGYLNDRFGAQICVTSALGLQAVAMLLMGWQRAEVLWAICVMAGIQGGIMNNVSSTVYAEYFGRDILGSVSGVVEMITNGGAALGPLCLTALMAVTGLPITTIFQWYAAPIVLGLLAIPTPRNYSWGPRNILDCGSL